MDEIKNQISQKGKIIVWGFVFLLFSASLLLIAQFVGELKSYKFLGQGIEFRNTITVSGKGEVAVVPDTAEFSFAVVEEAELVTRAQEKVTQTMNTIIDFLKDFGLDEKDIKTTNYNIVPRYEYRRSEITSPSLPFPPARGERVLVGYEVSHWISVKVREIDEAGEVLAQLGVLGATNISSIRFTVDDEEGAKDDARKKAITDAKTKAKTLARDLGVRLVKIVNFSESGGASILPRFCSSPSIRRRSRRSTCGAGDPSRRKSGNFKRDHYLCDRLISSRENEKAIQYIGLLF